MINIKKTIGWFREKKTFIYIIDNSYYYIGMNTFYECNEIEISKYKEFEKNYSESNIYEHPSTKLRFMTAEAFDQIIDKEDKEKTNKNAFIAFERKIKSLSDELQHITESSLKKQQDIFKLACSFKDEYDAEQMHNQLYQ